MRILLRLLGVIAGLTSCSITRGPSDLAGKVTNQPMILDIDCSSAFSDAAVTGLKGRLIHPAGSADNIYGALSFSNQNQASTISPAQSGVFSGKRSDSNDELILDLSPDDSRGQVRRIQIRTGQAASVLSLAALPNIAMRCRVSRFSNAAISRVFPMCNGAGTLTAGWYTDGQLVSHDDGCNNKVAACVSGPASPGGWQAFAKVNRRAVILSRCGGERYLPACEQSGTPLQGWYVNGRLLSADAQCHLRGVSCEELGTKREGWYSYERLPAGFLQAADCRKVEQQIASQPYRSQKTTFKTGGLSH